MSHSQALGDVHEVDLPTGRVRYREAGTGPPIVFVHGLLANGDLWRAVAPALAAGHRCITPDWPLGAHELGMGPDTDFSLPGLAGLVGEFLDALGLEDVTLVGNDTGGAIVLALLALRPGRVARVVITPCDAYDNFLPGILSHLYVAGRFPASLWIVGQSLRFKVLQRLPISFGCATLRPIDAATMRSYSAPLRNNGAVRRDFSQLIRAVSSRYTQQTAAQLEGGCDVEALVVWSSNDRLFPTGHGVRLATLLGAEPITVVQDSAALIPEDQPAALVALVADFLARAEPALRPTAEERPRAPARP
jgi:pimeloyl-ACP methyl ester carboxylesterase